jgi:hypothetical protein
MVVGQPLTLSPVMRTLPPAATLIGKWSQAPAAYELVMGIVVVVPPTVTLILWRRVVESQSYV